MNRSVILLGATAILMTTTLVSYPQTKRPAVYVDKRACPFECCTYRKWKTERMTVAYEQPDRSSRRVGKFKAGTWVTGLTGEVATLPGKFVIFKNHEKYKPGDVLWVYTPLGEGFYKVWFKGRMYQEELEYMNGPFEQSYPTCEQTPNCWGRLEKQLQVTWWVKVRSAEGWVGWSDKPENFSNKDACG
ncbi:MAG TPA: hypothetical protein VJ875_20660 [Pyrinomonadaceae bacterium]|nr:hypothetical protein [Pyrinomonadaceae bacterium]